MLRVWGSNGSVIDKRVKGGMSIHEAWMTNVVHSKRHSRPSINYDRMRLYQPVVIKL
jgi:hypothetical protein